jgi:hypothetical protein
MCCQSSLYFACEGLGFIYFVNTISGLLEPILVKPIFSSSCLQKYTNITFLKKFSPIVTYGAETWTLTSKMEKMLMTWERKILR